MALQIFTVVIILLSFSCFVEAVIVKCPAVPGVVSCQDFNKKLTVLMKCPDNNTKLRFWYTVIQFNNLQKLTISNCTKLSIDFEYKPIINHSVFRRNINTIDNVILENIKELIINKTSLASSNLFPENVTFHNVSYEKIYEDTFKQPIEVIITKPLKTLIFQNVTIDVIETKSFDDLKKLDNFIFKEVNVQRIQAHAIEVQMNPKKTFEIISSKIDVLEHLAMQITSKFVNIEMSEFVDVYPGGINGTSGNFIFQQNIVGNLQSGSLSLLTQNIKINDNRFQYLKSGAFERISPGLLQDSNMNFGNLRFTYEFRNNFLNFVEAGSLNPDITAYDNVATDILFTDNSVYCTCNNFGWILSEVGHGFNSELLEDFYKNVLDEVNKNVCTYTSCKLLIREVKNLIKNGKCLVNKTVEDVCKQLQKPTTVFTKLTTAIPTAKAMTTEIIIEPEEVEIPELHFDFLHNKPSRNWSSLKQVNYFLTLGIVFIICKCL